MIGLKGLIDQTNFERPAPDQKDAEACRIKFLSLVEGHHSLVDKAVSEMQQSTFRVAGVADYQATVDGFDELWRAYWNRGQIAPRAAETPKPPSNRVDANVASIDESLAFEVDCHVHLRFVEIL